MWKEADQACESQAGSRQHSPGAGQGRSQRLGHAQASLTPGCRLGSGSLCGSARKQTLTQGKTHCGVCRWALTLTSDPLAELDLRPELLPQR